jgi:hypothetical protein
MTVLFVEYGRAGDGRLPGTAGAVGTLGYTIRVVGVFTTGPRGESNLENTKVAAMERRGKIE